MAKCGNGWDTFVGVFSYVWDAVATASGSGSALAGLVPDACGNALVWERPVVYDYRSSTSIIQALVYGVALLAILYASLKVINLLTRSK